MGWKRVCSPNKQGGIGLINLNIWNQVTMLKCLWNICCKSDSLWIQWIHQVYLKGEYVLKVKPGQNWTWILKKVFAHKHLIANIQQLWSGMLQSRNFSMKKVYNLLIDDNNRVSWNSLLLHNIARPKAKLALWMLCHGHLPTKDRLIRFGFIHDNLCSMCGKSDENMNHIFFTCPNTSKICKDILTWLDINHTPGMWKDEINWIIT